MSKEVRDPDAAITTLHRAREYAVIERERARDEVNTCISNATKALRRADEADAAIREYDDGIATLTRELAAR